MGKVMGEGRADLDPAGRASATVGGLGTPAQRALIPTGDGQGGAKLERLFFAGVSASSPLGCAIGQSLAGQADASFEDDIRPKAGPWRRTVGGTRLRWWSDEGPTASRVTQERADCWSVDFHGTLSTAPGRCWRLVDGSGIPLLADYHALGRCHRAPFTASLFLIERRGSAEPWIVLAEAHLASAVRYRRLLDALGQAACDLIRAGLRADRPGRPWTALPLPPLRRRWLEHARCTARAMASWSRARLGGDLYGIAVLPASRNSLLRDAVIAPDRWIAIPAREGFIADPFFWPGRPDVALCEYYAHATGRGGLSAVSIGPTDVVVTPVMAGDHHLSYPFTFVDGDRVVCLPEMAASQRQILYELRADYSLSPLCTVAENVAMADPTVTRHAGLFWIAYTDANRNPYDNLCLMFARDLAGPWQQHPGNPVKIDVRSSRPGGAPFQFDGQWYRPAQDCSETYGGALTINAVQIWTIQDYAEVPIATLRADPKGPFPDGLHTICYQDGRILLDGKRVSYHPAIFWNKVRRRLLAHASRPARSVRATSVG